MRETTQELLQRLSDSIKHYDENAEEWFDITKESLQIAYERSKFISESLDIREVNLLWYLRCCSRSVSRTFYYAAEKQYEASLDLQKFRESIPQ